MIWVGCSGWSYKEWEGKFYPVGEKNRLVFYSNVFNSVEIDSTFYNVPGERSVKSWIKAVSGKKFRFSMKVPREISHYLFFRDFQRSNTEFRDFLSNIVKHFYDDNLLGSVLLQMPPYFGRNHLESLYKLLDIDFKYRIAVEVRNADLYHDNEMRKNLEGMNVCFVDTDSFENRLTGIGSGLDYAYVRLHGRNAGGWRAENPFDYKYSDDEIAAIERIVTEKKYADIFVYFNNHPRGNAPVNAIDLNSRLGFSTGRFF